jgi:hypothetical protein
MVFYKWFDPGRAQSAPEQHKYNAYLLT